ncbi:F-box DNA helicase 1 isoform X2 [Latimeria chalumnae]|uniref:F-box DNA helicase 1 isoform X2 n=1 Tax=Latimeria chalumnae TaxID=7897 RepID=UPI00313DD9E2
MESSNTRRLNQTTIKNYFPGIQRKVASVGKMAEEGGVQEEAVAGPSCSVGHQFFVIKDEKSPFAEPEQKPNIKRHLTSAADETQDFGDNWGRLAKKPCVYGLAQAPWLGCADQAPSLPERAIKREKEEEPAAEPVTNIHYGLLEAAACEEEPQGHIGQLPRELLMNIFSCLPALDLYRHISLVCQHWREIVKDPLFVPWKKLYYRYKMEESQAVQKVQQILTENKITEDQKLCVLNFIKYMANFKHDRSIKPEAIQLCLKGHPLYSQAEPCVSTRLPELGETTGTVNVWAATAVIVLLSDGVKDIQRLSACLSRPCSTLSVHVITEFLYCMATLLYAMRENGINISNRIHYNIYTSLYLRENTTHISTRIKSEGAPSNFSAAGRSSGTGVADIKLTHEQKQILNHEIAPGQVVKIMAFAGTGKTSTLAKYAEQRPHLRFLYVAFNKSVELEAKKVFPHNVECKTVHALAFRDIGKKYKIRKKLNWSGPSCFTVSYVLPKGRGGFIRAKQVVQTLNAFFASVDENVSSEHVPVWRKDTHGRRVLVLHKENQETVEDAQNIWGRMINLNERSEKAYYMTQDGYLKLWQLSKPSLGYDAIFIDEAQDCTPVIMNVFLSQSCGKILVGDPHQQIYSFRGAVNTLSEIPPTHVYYLTKSFRFGPEIAYIGATILEVCKQVTKKTLIGGNREGSIAGSTQGQLAVLSRTNTVVFDEAVRFTEGDTPAKIYIVGGVDRFGLNKILDLWRLLQPQEERQRRNLQIEDSFIGMFAKKGGYSALKDYVQKAEDKELEAKITIVEKYSYRIPELVHRIYRYATPLQAFANVVLGTVHKAKGLEFDTVQITDDFAKVPCGKHNIDRIPGFRVDLVPPDEWNLLYVAVTRAKKCLVMTKSLEYLLSLGGEYFLRSEVTSSLLKDEHLPTCAVNECNNAVSEEAVLTMKKIPITYGNGMNDLGGCYCCACVEQRLGPITYLAAPPSLVSSMEYTKENIDLPRNIAILLEMI